jgi:pyruvate carboxylase
MRVVESAEGLDDAIDQARREAGAAFGVPDVFLEKFIKRARHLEVQILGDRHGHLVHLFERDCSIQRRHQKVIEIAPAPNLDPAIRQELCDSAVRLASHVKYDNAGTVEFLYDTDASRFYFIEVNPRIQVEHTVTEIITGVDLIKSQILITQGAELGDPEINLPGQDAVHEQGFAFQCRITTEDPENKFTPDYGKITHYRSPGGLGLRLDGGLATTGAIITPFYDSLLVKVCASGRRFVDAARRMERALREFRVRGVKTNVPFLINVIEHPDFLEGRTTTSRSRCGAARRSTPRCGSSRKTPGIGSPNSARRSPTSSSRCSSGGRTPSATPVIPTTWSGPSSRSRPTPGSTCSGSSTP